MLENPAEEQGRPLDKAAMQLDQDSLFSFGSTPTVDISDIEETTETSVVKTGTPAVASGDSKQIEGSEVQQGESMQMSESASQPKGSAPLPTPSIGSAWDRLAISYQNALKASTEVVGYGPSVGSEAEYRLLGPLQGKRFLDLGCGGGQSLIAAAKQGAIAIGVDISVEQLAFARRLVEQEEVKVELKHGDLAELAFQRADGVDIVFSGFALQYVPDLNRVFRQVHRVLKPQGTFVFSLPHPSSAVTGEPRELVQSTDQLDLVNEQNAAIRRSYFSSEPVQTAGETGLVEYHHTTQDIFMGLVRSGFRVDVILEPEISTTYIPQALVMRARKEA